MLDKYFQTGNSSTENRGEKNSAVNKLKKKVTATIKEFQLFIPLFYITCATAWYTPKDRKSVV